MLRHVTVVTTVAIACATVLHGCGKHPRNGSCGEVRFTIQSDDFKFVDCDSNPSKSKNAIVAQVDSLVSMSFEHRGDGSRIDVRLEPSGGMFYSALVDWGDAEGQSAFEEWTISPDRRAAFRPATSPGNILSVYIWDDGPDSWDVQDFLAAVRFVVP
jgi:hypothetical protein